jgi:transcriptional antiterminator NusG
MNNWCVLFVKTGMEDKITEKLKSSIDLSLALPFTITKERYVRKAGALSLEKNICFPGYIFIQTDLPAGDLLVLTREGIKKIRDIYRFLTYDDRKGIFIREKELSPLMALCNGIACIEKSIGVVEGDVIKIISGPLAGREASITKIDKYRRRAILDLYIMGDIRSVAVGLEMAARI